MWECIESFTFAFSGSAGEGAYKFPDTLREEVKTMNGKAIIVMALSVAVLAMAPAASAKATPVFSGAIWNDGNLWGTVLTPTDLPDSAPDWSFDKLYNFADSGLSGQRSVSEAAPGDRDYNGGRWMVFAVTFTDLGKAVHDPDGDGIVDFELTSDAMVLEHRDLGHLEISDEPVRRFVCPLVPAKN